MPQDITTLTMPRIVIYADPDYPQKEYERLKALLESGKREEVIHELKILYPKDSYLANLLANRLGIDIQKELGILYHYQDTDSTTTAQITNENTIEITTQYDNFHDILEVIQNYSQYKGNVTDTLMAGISGIFGAVEKGAEKITELAGGKYQIAKYLFKAEGISVSAAYGYGSNSGDIVKTGIGLTFEIGLGIALEKALVISLVGIGATLSVLHLVIIAGISALVAALLLNTQAGKDFVNFLADKLKSFFSLFDSNPSKYELVSNPTLESNDYKSLIELLLDPNSNALDIDTLLHTFPNYLAYPTHTTADSINSLSLSNITDSIPMCIDALCLNHKNEPLANKEIYVYSPISLLL